VGNRLAAALIIISISVASAPARAEPTSGPTPLAEPTPSATPEGAPSPGASPTPDPSSSADPQAEPSPSADPSPTPEPSPSADPSPTPEPSSSAEPSPSADPSPTPEPSPTPSASPSADPSEEGPTLAASSEEMLVQEGDTIHYTLTVSNPSDAPVGPLQVVDLVPPEVRVDVEGLLEELPPGVGSVLYGDFLGQESITWDIPELPPGESVDLMFSAVATRAGDLAADNRARLESAGKVLDRAAHTTYLGEAATNEIDNPVFEPIVKHKVITRPVVQTPAPGGFSLLPATGVDPVPPLLASGLLVLLGAGLVRAASTRRRLSRSVLALVVGGLVLSACVSEDKGSSIAEVKGRRIEKDQGTGEGDGAGEGQQAQQDDNDSPGTKPDRDKGSDKNDARPDDQGDPGSGDDVVPPVVATTGEDEPTGSTMERTVKVVRVALGDLPVREVGSLVGDNRLRYSWDADSKRILSATSSQQVPQVRPLTLLTSLSRRRGSIRVVVELKNPSASRRVSVTGRLVHTVTADNGAQVRFESGKIDVVLAPNGTSRSSFSYQLPTGTYSATAAFEAAS
jgi:uncharacterized repeat protein (TIGR01451 family)